MKIVQLFLYVFLSTSSFGQFHTALSRSELGVMIGGTSYIGELNPYAPYKGVNLAGGILYRYNVHSRMSVRLNFLYGNLEGDDANSKIAINKERNLNFKTDIFEFAGGVEFNYFPFQLGHKKYKGTMYVLAEVGVFKMNPKTIYNDSEIELQPLGTEGQGTSLNSKKSYRLTQLTVPIGVGAKISMGKRASLNFEIGLRKTFTDYIDDVSSSIYVDPAALALENGSLAATLSNRSGRLYGQRGDSANKDWYMFGGMMLTVSLGDPKKCAFRN